MRFGGGDGGVAVGVAVGVGVNAVGLGVGVGEPSIPLWQCGSRRASSAVIAPINAAN